MATMHSALLLVSLLLVATAADYVPPPPTAPKTYKPPVPAAPKTPTPPVKPYVPPPKAPTPPVKPYVPPPKVPTPPVKPYLPPPTAPTPPVKPYTPPPKASTPPVVKAPSPVPFYGQGPPVKKEDCRPLCVKRCALHYKNSVCVRSCSTCCVRCKCVPPGPHAKKEVCGRCYTDMTTHGGRPKCP